LTCARFSAKLHTFADAAVPGIGCIVGRPSASADLVSVGEISQEACVRHLYRWAAGAAAASLFAVGGTALASGATPEQRAGAYLAANCANCHGTSGKAVGAMPSLAGQNKEYIALQMRAFRDGQRPATIMHQLTKGYSDAQIDAIAAHFARQPAAR
jgi:cytochrome c553